MGLVNYDNTPWGVDDPGGRNRLYQRSLNMFERNAHLIKDKHVLDLACNTGRMAYGVVSCGATKVTGVEFRQHLVDQGRESFASVGLADKMEFNQGDLFEFLRKSQPDTYDVVMCLGFLYHTVDQVEFFRQAKRLNPETIIVDTAVAKNYWWFGKQNWGKPPALFLGANEDPAEDRNTSDVDGIVFLPTTSFLEAMFDRIGYKWTRVPYNSSTVSNWDTMDAYKKGKRASYVAVRK
jgi:SAM-dependent methyltransferase